MPETPTPWLDNYPPGVPEHVELPKASLAGLLDDAARDFPHAPALHFEGRTISYAQLAQQARRFSGVLAGLGVGRGTKVGLILPNCPQAVVALFGALRLGATVVQNNPLYTERELGHQLADAGVEVLVCLDLVYDRVKALRPRTAIREVIVTSVLDELPGVKRVLAPFTKKGKAASASMLRPMAQITCRKNAPKEISNEMPKVTIVTSARISQRPRLTKKLQSSPFDLRRL